MKNSIEEYVEILERFSNENVIYGSTVGMTLEKYKDLQLSAEHILSDYKRVLKENELLRKDIEGWKKYCEEIEEERTEMSDKNCELEFEVVKLQKENEELKNLIAHKNAYTKMLEKDLFENCRNYVISRQKINKRL